MPAAAVVFEDVVVDGAGGRVLDGVTAEVAEGSLTGLAGPSGAGKTTMLRLVNRLSVPDSGRVSYRGRAVAALDVLELRRRVGLVFQRPVLLGGTIADNLRLAAPDETPAGLGAALERVGLDRSFLRRPATDVSGGEAQRVCVARTLLTRPDVLLLDEPTTGLDATPRRRFEELIGELVGDGLTALWVTHDTDQLVRLADRVLILIAGRIRFNGAPAGLAGAPHLRAFLTGDRGGG